MKILFGDLYLTHCLLFVNIEMIWTKIGFSQISDVAIDLINQRKKMHENDNTNLYYSRENEIFNVFEIF